MVQKIKMSNLLTMDHVISTLETPVLVAAEIRTFKGGESYKRLTFTPLTSTFTVTVKDTFLSIKSERITSVSMAVQVYNNHKLTGEKYTLRSHTEEEIKDEISSARRLVGDSEKEITMPNMPKSTFDFNA